MINFGVPPLESDLVYERVRESYDRVAQRYATEMGGELAGKPLDRALLRALAELVTDVTESSGPGVIGDLGCGPGHIAAYLSGLGASALGVDISPAMIEVGRDKFPAVQFRVGSLLALPLVDGELAGAVAFYSILHLRPEDRPAAYTEMARAVRPGGWLLVGFHVCLLGQDPGGIMHVDEWWGETVDLDFFYLDPVEVVQGLAAAGFELVARTDREPFPAVELASRRSYLLCRRS
jgi:SAM-dependent methyltransferase